MSDKVLANRVFIEEIVKMMMKESRSITNAPDGALLTELVEGPGGTNMNQMLSQAKKELDDGPENRKGFLNKLSLLTDFTLEIMEKTALISRKAVKNLNKSFFYANNTVKQALNNLTPEGNFADAEISEIKDYFRLFNDVCTTGFEFRSSAGIHKPLFIQEPTYYCIDRALKQSLDFWQNRRSNFISAIKRSKSSDEISKIYEKEVKSFSDYLSRESSIEGPGSDNSIDSDVVRFLSSAELNDANKLDQYCGFDLLFLSIKEVKQYHEKIKSRVAVSLAKEAKKSWSNYLSEKYRIWFLEKRLLKDEKLLRTWMVYCFAMHNDPFGEHSLDWWSSMLDSKNPRAAGKTTDQTRVDRDGKKVASIDEPTDDPAMVTSMVNVVAISMADWEMAALASRQVLQLGVLGSRLAAAAKAGSVGGPWGSALMLVGVLAHTAAVWYKPFGLFSDIGDLSVYFDRSIEELEKLIRNLTGLVNKRNPMMLVAANEYMTEHSIEMKKNIVAAERLLSDSISKTVQSPILKKGSGDKIQERYVLLQQCSQMLNALGETFNFKNEDLFLAQFSKGDGSTEAAAVKILTETINLSKQTLNNLAGGRDTFIKVLDMSEKMGQQMRGSFFSGVLDESSLPDAKLVLEKEEEPNADILKIPKLKPSGPDKTAEDPPKTVAAASDPGIPGKIQALATSFGLDFTAGSPDSVSLAAIELKKKLDLAAQKHNSSTPKKEPKRYNKIFQGQWNNFGRKDFGTGTGIFDPKPGVKMAISSPDFLNDFVYAYTVKEGQGVPTSKKRAAWAITAPLTGVLNTSFYYKDAMPVVEINIRSLKKSKSKVETRIPFLQSIFPELKNSDSRSIEETYKNAYSEYTQHLALASKNPKLKKRVLFKWQVARLHVLRLCVMVEKLYSKQVREILKKDIEDTKRLRDLVTGLESFNKKELERQWRSSIMIINKLQVNKVYYFELIMSKYSLFSKQINLPEALLGLKSYQGSA